MSTLVSGSPSFRAQIDSNGKTKAVFSVPFTHSVPVRIGLGLSKVGTTIAITSFTDVALLLLIWLFVNVRPVREFCLFAAVVIITDWFMLHTFFLTVSQHTHTGLGLKADSVHRRTTSGACRRLGVEWAT